MTISTKPHQIASKNILCIIEDYLLEDLPGTISANHSSNRAAAHTRPALEAEENLLSCGKAFERLLSF